MLSQNRAVSAPSSTIRCQPWVLPALGARDARSTRCSISSVGNGIGPEGPGHPPAADDGVELGQERAPSFTRSSAIVQPYTTSVPPASGTQSNSATSPPATDSGLACSWSRNPFWPFDVHTNVISS